MTTTVRFRRLHPNAIIPTRAHPGDAGLDLYAWYTRPIFLDPHARHLVPTGVAVAIPPGHVGLICPRSGLAKTSGLTVLNAPGIIDSGYRGELAVLLLNTSSTLQTVRHGDRIAQLVIVPVSMVEPVEVETLDETERGAQGFGSSGQ